MTEFQWEKTTDRPEVASLLRKIADGLDGGGEIELGQEEWELKLSVAEKVALDVEVEIDEKTTELEIELRWSTGSAGES